MNITQILLRSPVDSAAYRVTSQTNAVSVEADLRNSELIQLLNTLRTKQDGLKKVLGISSKAQHKNLINKFTNGFKCFRREKFPYEVAEYMRVGEAMQIINVELSERRNCRRFVANVQKGEL